MGDDYVDLTTCENRCYMKRGTLLHPIKGDVGAFVALMKRDTGKKASFFLSLKNDQSVPSLAEILTTLIYFFLSHTIA